jgi:spore germination protein GerM
MGRFKFAGALLIAVASLVGCAIRVEETARPVPERDRGQFGVQEAGDAAAGTSRIFLLAAATGDQDASLRSVRRNVPDDPQDIFESLIAGPNDVEREAGLTSNLPDDLMLISARLRGRILTANVNDVFDELTPDALRVAVAQLVATANEIDGAENLRLQIDGENQAWPLGDGQNTERLLTIYDYPGFVESSQPAYPALPTANTPSE